MAYILATYFIGPLSRYDGSRNSDYASITLFETNEKATQHVIDFIIENVKESNADLDQNRVISDSDIIKIRKKLNKYGRYTFDDTYMFTIEYAEISL